MPGPVLGLGTDVEHDHLAARQPLLKLGGGDLLDPVPFAQILVGENAHLGHMANRDVADGGPQLADPLVGQTVEDPVPLTPRADQPGSRQHLQVLRGVRDALRDLTRELLDRALPLIEDVDDLRPPTAPERLRDRRQRIEQRHLRRTTRHILKLSLEYLKIKSACVISTREIRPIPDAQARVTGHDQADMKTLVILNDPAYGTEPGRKDSR